MLMLLTSIIFAGAAAGWFYVALELRKTYQQQARIKQALASQEWKGDYLTWLTK